MLEGISSSNVLRFLIMKISSIDAFSTDRAVQGILTTTLVDGLVRRDIRRFQAGRESGFIYHRAKACLMPLTVLPWAVYQALPASMTPVLILLPAAFLLAVTVDISAASFKKHL